VRVLCSLGLALVACSGADDSDVVDSDAADTDVADTDTRPQVVFTTSLGAFTVALDEVSAPVTAANFLTYVDEGFFDGDDSEGPTLFHRVISGFMVQGGGYTATGAQKATHDPIGLESDNGRSNTRGTIAMARTNVPDSATSQFFVNHIDNAFLDYSMQNDGYAVFGDVTDGLDTIDAIAAVETNGQDRPTTDVVITDCERR